jgi:hypothetical protein
VSPVAKITVSLASLALLAGVTACAPTPEPAPAAEVVPTASATPTPAASAEVTPTPTEPVTAAVTAPRYCNSDYAPPLGTTPYDQGPMKGAMGEVEVVDGLPTSYTVADNDSLPAIGQRFCIDYATIGVMTDIERHRDIYPGDVLKLRP